MADDKKTFDLNTDRITQEEAWKFIRSFEQRLESGSAGYREHRECGTRFPRNEPCPKCGKRLLED